jgi:hypothetical protein
MLTHAASTEPLNTFAMAFDADCGVLFKYGSFLKVKEWHDAAKDSYIRSGCTGLADGLVLIEGKFPADEINKCLSTAGYVTKFYEKIRNGEFRDPHSDGYSHEFDVMDANAGLAEISIMSAPSA